MPQSEKKIIPCRRQSRKLLFFSKFPSSLSRLAWKSRPWCVRPSTKCVRTQETSKTRKKKLRLAVCAPLSNAFLASVYVWPSTLWDAFVVASGGCSNLANEIARDTTEKREGQVEASTGIRFWVVDMEAGEQTNTATKNCVEWCTRVTMIADLITARHIYTHFWIIINHVVRRLKSRVNRK